jgi:hypothetical protein
MARRKLLQATGWRKRLRADGYNHMLPPDASYDLDKARKLIHSAAPPFHISAEAPAVANPPASATEAQFPGADMMRNALGALPRGVRSVLVFMPAHASRIPGLAAPEAALLQRCKAAMAAVAVERGDWLIDAMWRSVWTLPDANYWDSVHFRDQIARELIGGIGAVTSGTLAQQSGLRVLVHGR